MSNNEKPYWLKMFEINVEKALDQDRKADEIMTQQVYRATSEKLAEKRAEGYGGWHEPEMCSVEELKEMLASHINKGDWVDILNFAGMIYVRTEMEKWNEERYC